MKLSAKSIIESIKKGERSKGAVNLYLDKVQLQEFKAACHKLGVSPNRVIDQLIKEFLSSTK